MVSVDQVVRQGGRVERVVMDINGVYFVFKRIKQEIRIVSRYCYDNALNLDKLRVNKGSFARVMKQVSGIFGRV